MSTEENVIKALMMVSQKFRHMKGEITAPDIADALEYVAEELQAQIAVAAWAERRYG